MPELIVVGLIYAALALDHIAVGQFMVCRPIVVGPVIGWYLGDARLGLLAGAAVELLWVHVIPVGVWPIDTTSVAALSVTWCLMSARPGRASWTLALLLAIPCGVAIRHADIWFRRQNGRFIPWVTDALERGDETVLTKAVLLSLLLWALKAWGMFLVFGLAGNFLLDPLLQACSPRMLLSLDFAGRVLPLVGFCVVLNYFLERMTLTWPWTPDKPSPL